MKIKWHYSLIISLLALVGASQIEFAVPNQEIIVDFSSEITSPLDTETAVAEITIQLENTGASSIKVTKQLNRYRITYYSAKDVSAIKTVFSQDSALVLGGSIPESSQDTELPIENDTTSYQLNFSELQQGNDIAKDFNGHLVNTESTTIRYFNPFVYFSFNGISLAEEQRFVTTALKINKEITLTMVSVDYKIPEVRAGPLS